MKFYDIFRKKLNLHDTFMTYSRNLNETFMKFSWNFHVSMKFVRNFHEYSLFGWCMCRLDDLVKGHLLTLKICRKFMDTKLQTLFSYKALCFNLRRNFLDRILLSRDQRLPPASPPKYKIPLPCSPLRSISYCSIDRILVHILLTTVRTTQMTHLRELLMGS